MGPVRSALQHLEQGTSMVGQYAIKFHIFDSKIAWNNEVLVAAFCAGLFGYIKDKLAGCDLSSGIDNLLSVATRVDRLFRERTQEREYARQYPDLTFSIVL